MTQWICLAILQPSRNGTCHGALVRTSVDDLNSIEGIDTIKVIMDENPEFQDTRTCQDLVKRKAQYDILYALPGTKFTRAAVKQRFEMEHGHKLYIEPAPTAYKEGR